MYTVRMFRFTVHSPQVQTDLFTSDSYELALSIFIHLWGMHYELKKDHRDIWVQMFDNFGNIVKEDRWTSRGGYSKQMSDGGKS